MMVDTFQLSDKPFPGFELITWEHQSKTPGTLWDMGIDAGFTLIGRGMVSGQLWFAHNIDKIRELDYFMGVDSGLTEPVKTKVSVDDGDLVVNLEAIVYRLKEIKSIYNIVGDGKWLLKRM